MTPKSPERQVQDRAYRVANKEKMAAYQKAYRELHRQELAAQKQAHRKANREWLLRQREYQVAHPLEMRLYHINSRAKKMGHPEKIALSELECMLAVTHGVCPACHRAFGEAKTQWTFDHVIPLCQPDGKHSMENGQIVCWECNVRKHKQTARYAI